MNFILIFFHDSLKFISSKTRVEDNRPRTINIIIILAIFICIPNVYSQNTTIVFNTKENSTIGISKEIDNTFTRTLSNNINTDTTGRGIYNWDVNDFQFVNCSFHDGRFAFFPIKQGCDLIITYKGEGQFEFEGTDKAEVEFYTNGYKDIARPFIESLFSFPNESGFEDFSLMIEKHHSLLSNILDSLCIENKISSKFSDIIKNEFHMITSCIAIEKYRTRYLENAETKVNQEDSIKVENMITGILDKISPIIDSGDIFKYNLGRSASAVYYTNRYRHLSKENKDELLTRNVWAGYLEPHRLGYLIAPKEIQYKLLSLELLDNYNNGVIKGNSAFFDYISETRPQNAFLPYIKEKRDELLVSMNTDHSGIKYIEDSINTLKDLSMVGELDQKILYIDIWATWCGPCIAEFKHKDKLYELLSNYEDIIPVYISLDENKDDISWKERTKTFNLNGYHLRANENLVDDINEKLFDGTGIGIPRYILLDREGNILDKMLSGPSKIEKLKEELDKYFD